MVDKKILEESVFGEAEKFIQKWDSNEIELKPEAMNWTHTTKKSRFSTQKSNLADYISSIIAAYKKVRTEALFAIDSTDHMTKQFLVPALLKALKEAAEDVVEIKTRIEGKKGFKAGEAVFKKIQTLEEQLKQEKDAKQGRSYYEQRLTANRLLPQRDYQMDEKLCFVLMPFDPKFRKIFEDVIKSAASEVGLEAKRADDIFGSTPIINDIWEYINKARIIVADLSERNPNVFYEVGLAHAIGQEVILMARNIDDIPFDLRHLRCFIYADSVAGTSKLKSNLIASMKSVSAVNNTKNPKATSEKPPFILQRIVDNRIRKIRLFYVTTNIERCEIHFNDRPLIWDRVNRPEKTIGEGGGGNAVVPDSIFDEEGIVTIKYDGSTVRRKYKDLIEADP